ncbi:sporulation protein YjcZ [Bacillus cereus group sp. Bce025]|nr:MULTISPECIES: sporulation protein YjcZ [Bacillus cereus group]MDA2480720.1 sporulation protein YjcZ [Bacillus cereus]MDA2497788.1 sporulation protein YjcZ [Bacillus cereus]MRC32299.1 sporulation protein YjcZ [Bacillus thuringiensis]
MSYGGSCGGFSSDFSLLIILFSLLIIIRCRCCGGGFEN